MLDNETKLDEASNIAEQIGRFLPGLYLEMKNEPKAELGESFDVWEINTRELEQAIEGRKFPAQATDLQHHQILFDGRANAYALSEKLSSGSHQVFKVGVSNVARKIHKAIKRLERDEGEEVSQETDNNGLTSVRLLKTSAFWVYAFWLVDRHEVYVISAPSRFKRLRAGRYLKEKNFIRRLRDEIEPLSPKGEESGGRFRARL
jgi:hypothetical protein